MQKITISEVARQAGVSVSTVSRVINGNNSVDPILRQRVMDTVEELDYIPNANARSTRAGSSRAVSVIVPTVQIAVFASILQGAMDTAAKNNLHINVFSSQGDEERDLRCLREILASNPSGLIYCPINREGESDLEAVRALKIPAVIAMRRSVVPGIPHIYMDDRGGAYRATKYLLQQGHRRIAFFAGFWENPADSPEDILRLADTELCGAFSSLERLCGYRRALAEFGMEFDRNLFALTRFDYQSGYDTMKKFLSELIDFDAVICGNDLVATGVLQVLQEQRIQVPERVSLVGFDDSYLARISYPKLTSVRQCPYEIGKKSVEAIVDMLQGKHVQNQKLEAVLTIRNSTAAK